MTFSVPQELQHLERSNVAFEKEIADLKAELERYTKTLQQHEPHCLLHSKSRPACHVPPPPPAMSFTSTTSTSTLPFNIGPTTAVARGASSATSHGDASHHDLSLTELLVSSDLPQLCTSDLWSLGLNPSF